MIIGYVLACEKSAAGAINPLWFPVRYRITKRNKKRFEAAVRKRYRKLNEWTIAEDIQKDYHYRVGIYYRENLNRIRCHPAYEEVSGIGCKCREHEKNIKKLYSLVSK